MGAPILPAGLGDVVLTAIQQLNNNDENIHIVMIAVKEGEPPSMVSSIHPDTVVEVLQFCIDFHHNATVRVEAIDTPEKKDMN